MKLTRRNVTALVVCCMLLLTLNGCSQVKSVFPFFGDKNESSSSDVISESTSSEEPVPVDPNWPVSIGDISLFEEPATVMSLSPALTEMVCELGGADKLAGISEFCDFPLEVQGRVRLGTAATPKLDAILQAQPALVLTSVTLTTEVTQALQAASIPVLVLPRADSMQSLEQTYVILSTALWGIEDGALMASQVFTPIQQHYDTLANAAVSVTSPFSGIWLRAVPLLMATGDSWESRLLTEVLNVTNDAAEFTQWEYPADKAVDLYPDVIFYADSVNPDYFKGTQVYNTTDAYKQKRMYPFDAVVFERQSGRFVDELHRMLLQVYPELEAQVGAAPERPEEVLALPGT